MLERLRHPLAGAVLLAPVLAGVSVVPATATLAADETCNGVPATIVGTPGGRVFGTPLDDVIVSNGADYVDGADGNDLICTTNTQAHKRRVFSVSGGRGNNVIDRRGDLETGGPPAQVWLSGDSEVFLGGPGPEQVSVERAAGTPFSGQVSVQTGDGDDSVYVDSLTRFAVPATIDTGDGDDQVAVTDTVANLQVAGGHGVDTLATADNRRGTWEVDARAGLLTFSATNQLSFSGFDVYSFSLANPRTKVDFRGSSRPEEVVLEARGRLRLARMGAGDDVVRFARFARPPKTDLAGGRGTDRLAVFADRRVAVDVDLAARSFSVGRDQGNRLRQFEDVTAEGGRVTITGDRRDNDLEWWGCEGGLVKGGDGDDRISPVPPSRVCASVHMTAYGGAGSDKLTGSRGRDLLNGGAGRDKANGGPGFDTCLAAEVVTACERTS